MATISCAPPEGAVATPLFTFQHSMVPRSASSKKKTDAASSPKSVILDMHLLSPGSSSPNSKCQPRSLDRSYSTSDGEFSELDYVLDSVGTAQELDKSENSGPLETLPVTHSLALEVANVCVPTKWEVSETLSTSLKRRDDKPLCRIPLFPAVNGLEPTSESSSVFILGGRTSRDLGRSQYGATQQSSAALQSAKYCEERTITARENDRVSPASASEVSAAGEQRRETNSKWSQTTIMSSKRPSDQHEKVSSSSSARRYPSSESVLTTRRRDPISRVKYSAGPSPTVATVPLQSIDGNRRKSVKPSAVTNCGYPGIPVRFFGPGFNTHAYSASPRVQTAARNNYTLTPNSSNVGLHPHRFLSGPLLGGMMLKPPPSKWDDAEKWIVSPRRKQYPNQPHHRALPTPLIGRRHSIAGGQIIHPHQGMDTADFSTLPGRKVTSPQFEHSFVNDPNRSNSLKKRSRALSFDDLSRESYQSSLESSKSPIQKEDNDQKGKDSILEFFIVNDKSIELSKWPLLTPNVDEERQTHHPVNASAAADCMMNTSSEGSKRVQVSKQSRSDSFSFEELSTVLVAAPQFSLQGPNGCRDMGGTQMSLVETPKNSTCLMPGDMESPTMPNTPPGTRAIPVVMDSLEPQTRPLETRELHDVAGDDQRYLDRSYNWTTSEEEEIKSAASLRGEPEALGRFQLAAKTTSWGEAKRAKAAVRFRNKEATIKVWEERQKAQAEAEMKKTEAKVEKMLAVAQEKMKARLASASRKASKMTTANKKIQDRQASKIAVRLGLMRKASFQDSPSSKTSFKCFFWGLWR